MSFAQGISSTEGAVIISCSDLPPEEIIHQILGVETVPQPFLTNENIKGYPWLVETKYYTAKANLFAVATKTVFSASFADAIRATVFYFDSKKPSSFEDVLKWMPFVQDLSSDVQLLVCSNCSEDGNVTALERKNIMDWCLKNQFELVELEPIEEINDEVEDMFKDTKGYARVVQALHSYPWANLVMKEEPHKPSKRLLDKLHLEETKSSETVLQNMKELSLCELSSSQNMCQHNPENVLQEDQAVKDSDSKSDQLLEEEQWLLNVIGQDDANGESFESLFAKFHDMKEKASGLTGDERKKYAEEVAIAFWRALGGDEEEIAGLSD